MTLSIAYSLQDLYFHYPQIRRSYFFLPREHLSVIQWSMCGVHEPFVWYGPNHPTLAEHCLRVLETVFEYWENYNYVEEMSGIRFAGESQYLSIFDYTEKMVNYLCLSTANLLGKSESGVLVKALETNLINYDLITLKVQEQQRSTPSST